MPRPEHIHLLLLHPDDAVAPLIERHLHEHLPLISIKRLKLAADIASIDLDAFDMLLIDTNLPDAVALNLLDDLLTVRPDLPVVFIGGPSKRPNMNEAMRNGAYDYIVSAGDYIRSIPFVIQKNLSVARMRADNHRLNAQLRQTLKVVQRKNSELEQAVEDLQTAAGTDPLTDLANRRAIAHTLDRMFAECARYERDLACIMIDLDSFKPFNDTLGHPRGDELLQMVGRVLQANCRKSDLAGRFGGDEFIVLLPETEAARAEQVATRIRDQFINQADALLKEVGSRLHLSMSIGIATIHEARPFSPEQLVSFADQALYRAKRAGRGRIITYRGNTRIATSFSA